MQEGLQHPRAPSDEYLFHLVDAPRYIALPNSLNLPSLASKQSCVSNVPVHVSLNLGRPVRLIRLGRMGGLAVVTVPEAAIDEHSEPVAREKEIRTSWQVASMDAETVPGCMQRSSDVHFGPCIAAANCRHVPTALPRGGVKTGQTASGTISLAVLHLLDIATLAFCSQVAD